MDRFFAMPPLAAAALYVGVLTFQLMMLKGYVSAQRYKHKVPAGDLSNPEFARATRVQLNAVEDVPALMVGLVLLALAGAPAAYIHATGAALVVFRILHAVGLAAPGGQGFGRREGALGTVLVYLATASGLIVYAFKLAA